MMLRWNETTGVFETFTNTWANIAPGLKHKDAALQLGAGSTVVNAQTRFWHATPFGDRCLYVIGDNNSERDYTSPVTANKNVPSGTRPMMAASGYAVDDGNGGRTLKADRIVLPDGYWPIDFCVSGGAVYMLAFAYNSADQNVRHGVWKSTDGVNFTQVLSFDYQQVMMSLEYLNGYFYFGVAHKNAMIALGVLKSGTSENAGSVYRVKDPGYNWFYEDAGFACSEDTPFEYAPRTAPDESVCRVDVCMEIMPVGKAELQALDTAGMQGCIAKILDAKGLEYAVLTEGGWTMVGNDSMNVTAGEITKVSFAIDYSESPSRITYWVADNTLTNETGESSFVCAQQKSSIKTIGAQGDGTISVWAGKYTFTTPGVQDVPAGTTNVLSSSLADFTAETFRVAGGGMMVIPRDKIPGSGVNSKLRVDGDSSLMFDMTGSSTLPTVTKLFNGVGSAFEIGSNLKVVVDGQGVDRLAKLFVKDGNLEARVAERPAFEPESAAEEPFSVVSDGESATVSASIGNAVEGFWYGLETTDDLKAKQFALDADSVKQCTETGVMKLNSSVEDGADAGFYRVSVSADEP